MITLDGWFDFAERYPGPGDKVWPDFNIVQGVVMHSAEGSLQGVINVVMGPLQRSVTAVVGLDGRLVQFYPVDKSPWANGSHTANKIFLGIEHENEYQNGHPIETFFTDAQVETDIRIIKDLSEYKHRPLSYWRRSIHSDDLHASLYEHQEMRRFGATPTACPSGRVPWAKILKGLEEPVFNFICGNVNGGIEKRGHQLLIWNEGVTVMIIGNEDGSRVGQIAKNFGGDFFWLLKEDPMATWSPNPGD